MNVLRSLTLIGGTVLISYACTAKQQPLQDEFVDYGLDGDERPTRDAINWKMINPSHRDFDRYSKSSFPLSILVGSAKNVSEMIPAAAQHPALSYVFHSINGCVLGVRTGIVELGHFIYLDRFIPVQMPLAAGSMIRGDLQKKSYLSFQTFIHPHLSKRNFRRCAEVFWGRKVFLGHFNLRGSQVSLVAQGRKKKGSIKKIPWEKDNPVGIYLSWAKTAPYPRLIDELGVSANLHSPMYSIEHGVQGHFFVSLTLKLASNWSGFQVSPKAIAY